MKVLLVASEVAPFARSGGLAEVAGFLSGALWAEGVEADVILPLYSSVDAGRFGLEDTGRSVEVMVAGRKVRGGIYACNLPLAKGRAFFIRHDGYYGRPSLYGATEGDYADNCERFAFFCRAALEAVEVLGLEPDIIHCHDWQTGLVPVCLRTAYRDSRRLARARSIMTVHNLAYQGVFWHWDWPLLGLDWSFFNWQALEFYGKINMLKGGLLYADAITTVSRTYSREIQTPEHGCGLDGVFRYRKEVVHGHVSGLDVSRWDPSCDPCIPANFSAADMAGKVECKKALQRECGLEHGPGNLLCGVVGRLAEQKGIDLLLECGDELMMRLPVQLVILGTGSKRLKAGVEELARRYPGRVFARVAHDEDFARRLFAGCDLYLAPSRFEPCGLSHLIAMRYGAVPVARSTGGLADTVVDYTPEDASAGLSTGFVFLEYNAASLFDQVERAAGCYADNEKWTLLVRNCLNQDWSFRRTAAWYREMYKRVAAD